MEQKEEKPCEAETTVSPAAEVPGTPGGTASSEEARDAAGATLKDGPPDGPGTKGATAPEEGSSDDFPGQANGSDEVKGKSRTEPSRKEEAKADLVEEEEEGEEGKVTVASPLKTKEETTPEPTEAEEKKAATPTSEKQGADENEAKLESKEKTLVGDKAEPEAVEIVGEEAADKPQQEADGKDEAKAKAQEADGPEAGGDAEEVEEPGSPTAEQAQDREKESKEGASLTPSSPEEWPESPTDEGHSPDALGPDSTASGETSPSAGESSPSDVPQSPTEAPASEEKKKDRGPERRVSAPARPRGPRAQNRKAIVDKFGGAASGPTALFRNTKAAGAAIGGVKNMLLEWCRAMTRHYEHVDIQNFSSSWSSGMAFCALIHKFFPDAFDYAELDPAKRRHNFTLAFSTAEKMADCAQLLDVDDMVRFAVPDSKCVYTYIQELYRSLVQKGLVKTKKK